MEKVIDINGQIVTFKADGSLPLRYQVNFQKDYFGDMVGLEKALKEGMENLDTQPMYRMAYTMAKAAASDLPPMMDWLVSFEDGFPILEVYTELQDLMSANLQAMKKPKKK